MASSAGDRVAIHLGNTVEAVVSIFAVLKAGAVFVMISPAQKRERLVYILNHCRACSLITGAKFHKTEFPLRKEVPSLKLSLPAASR